MLLQLDIFLKELLNTEDLSYGSAVFDHLDEIFYWKDSKGIIMISFYLIIVKFVVLIVQYRLHFDFSSNKSLMP